jgi:hypothetical protein
LNYREINTLNILIKSADCGIWVNYSRICDMNHRFSSCNLFIFFEIVRNKNEMVCKGVKLVMVANTILLKKLLTPVTIYDNIHFTYMADNPSVESEVI